MNILTDFPYLIPQEPDGFHYNGYISIKERQLEKETGFEESSSQLCRQLITDIEDLGWEKLAYVDDDFQEIHLAYTDSDGRTHVLKLYINKQAMTVKLIAR
ncbi:hypothetical protein MAR_001073 [Mya arenaria]|uniref:FANCL UBC-like domain-containing protein n=1 Tax=Mya arenaria TaxID=6604 RepID=A0ABY7FAM7_MYAAR|nr:hypothetical protein MAR_001073 [Mya arenaria]